MRYTFLIAIVATFLIGACGGQPAAQTTDTPSGAAGAPTAAATEEAFVSPRSAPVPSPATSAATVQPTAAAEPTARLILPGATEAPTDAATAAPEATAAAPTAVT